MKKIQKQKSHAFGKDVYLLGKDKFGEYLWLEAGSWDCDWYWGFGYVETYTNNNNPHLAKDIQSHSHIDGHIFKKGENGDYIHTWNDNPDLEETVLTESESWEFSDLMKSFYTLRETASLYHQGNSHLTAGVEITLKNKQAEKRINEKEIPVIMERIYEILAPTVK